MKKIVIAVLAAFSLSAFAADKYTIDSHHTFPIFEVSHLGFSMQRGRFNLTSGSIELDTAAKKGSVDLTIEAASIDMGFAKWNEHMAGPDFFNVEKFPKITFVSDELLFTGNQVTGAKGKFTLLGVTRPLTLTVENFHCGKHPMFPRVLCGAEVTAKLLRSDYGMTKYLPGISDEVIVRIPIEAIKN